jgi:magnesium chelatase subunit I
MNPEEGLLRPQIQDRFGLRVLVRGVTNIKERMEIYRRAVAYKNKPYKFVSDWEAETESAMEEVGEARKRLSKVQLSAAVEEKALTWIKRLKIDSHRAEMTLFEAGRALAAADGRLDVTLDDLRTVAPMALRQRQTDIASSYFAEQEKEDKRILEVIGENSEPSRGKPKRSGKAAAKSANSDKVATADPAASETAPVIEEG